MKAGGQTDRRTDGRTDKYGRREGRTNPAKEASHTGKEKGSEEWLAMEKTSPFV